MSELRRNIFTGEWTVCAKQRKNRPYEFIHKTQAISDSGEHCPFCSGHEEWTTEAVYQDGQDDHWQIRVFPNKFPALSQTSSPVEKDCFYNQVAGIGYHEVLVDTPSHLAKINEFSAEHIKRILLVLQERQRKIADHTEINYTQIFKNCGPSAGMSLQHSHWQVLGLPVVPERVAKISNAIGEECLFCKMLAHEQEVGNRIVAENQTFVALTPYASRFSYELWIAPKAHSESFSTVTQEEMRQLSRLLRVVLNQVTKLKKDIGYNICVMDAPKGKPFHWYIEILPRIGGFAGFEYATGSYINPVMPEDAAKFYREEK